MLPDRYHLSWCRELLHSGQIERRSAAPGKTLPVRLDGDAIQLDSAIDRDRGNWHESLLIRVAEHEKVGRDRIAHQRSREARRVDEIDVRSADRGA